MFLKDNMNIIKVDNSNPISNIDGLKEFYINVKPLIEQRLAEFKEPKDKLALFRELCFCILTANASAKMGLKSIDTLNDLIFYATEEHITQKLKGVYRFPVTRASYIVRSRDFLQKEWNMDIHNIFNTYKNNAILRDYLKDNIIGIGYKECSHFLRNVGFEDFAILDKHVISMLNLLGCVVQKPKNKKEYKKIESMMINFAKKIDININHLDLLFWSYKTGEIIK
jgi:N-glycosylase/DNA lyase